MTQIFAVHSGYGLMTAVAAIDAGLVPPEGAHDGERILVPINQARIPETSPAVHESPALAPLLRRFARVEPLADLVTPQHPAAWDPPETDLPLLERLFTRAWGLEGPIELFVQSPQVPPARTLMSLFSSARIGVIGDGLMTYSPIRIPLPPPVTARIRSVVYADIVPGVEPLVFRETRAARVPVPAAAFRAVLEETDGAARPPVEEATALVLGQYLSELGILTPVEEQRMQAAMIDRAADAGVRAVVFKPHPAAPPSATDAVRARAAVRGLSFRIHRGDEPAELLAHDLGAALVVAGFSTALPTVRALYGTPIAAVGAETVLARLRPFENSNRVPATIVDALTRRDGRHADAAALQELVDAVGFVMQPALLSASRERTAAFLAGLPQTERERYFDLRRLGDLGLPGGEEPRGLRRLLRSRGGIDRGETLRLTVQGARNRAARVWKEIRGR